MASTEVGPWFINCIEPTEGITLSPVTNLVSWLKVSLPLTFAEAADILPITLSDETLVEPAVKLPDDKSDPTDKAFEMLPEAADILPITLREETLVDPAVKPPEIPKFPLIVSEVFLSGVYPKTLINSVLDSVNPAVRFGRPSRKNLNSL